MKNLIIILLLIPTLAWGQKKELVVGQNAHYLVKIMTSVGNIDIDLSNLTPMHRDNFVKLARSGFYDNIIFHRVIKNFMIQAGDPDSKKSSAVASYGDNDSGYLLDAEINDQLFHKKGALAAARIPDNENPLRKSSGSQFYIVVGKVLNDSALNIAKKIIEKSNGHIITPQREKVYKSIGGAPHLDGSYTIFGEVKNGMKVVEKISLTKTNKQNRPTEDIFIKKIEVKIIKD